MVDDMIDMVRQLRSGESDAQLAVLIGLTPDQLLNDDQVTRAVARCLRAADTRVRQLAFRRLEGMHDVRDTVLPELVSLLQEPDRDVAGLAAACLAERKATIQPSLRTFLKARARALLQSTSFEARRGALKLLEQVGAGDRAVAWEVLQTMISEEPRISAAAGAAVCHLHLHPLELSAHVERIRQTGGRRALPGIAMAYAGFEDVPVDEIGLLPEPLPHESVYRGTAIALGMDGGCLPDWGWPVIVLSMLSHDTLTCEMSCLAWQKLLGEKSGIGLVSRNHPRRYEDALDALVNDVSHGHIAPASLVAAVFKAYRRTVPSFEIPTQPPMATDPQYLIPPLAAIAQRHAGVAAAADAAVDRLVRMTDDFTARAAAAQFVAHRRECREPTLEALSQWIFEREARTLMAVRAVGSLRQPTERVITILRSAFGGTPLEVQEAATNALGAYGPAALAALPTVVRYHAFREGASTAAEQAITAIVAGAPSRACLLVAELTAHIHGATSGGVATLLSLARALLPTIRGRPEYVQLVEQLRNELGLRLLFEGDAKLRSDLFEFEQQLGRDE